MHLINAQQQHQPHVLPSHQYLLDTTTTTTIRSSNWWMMMMMSM
jgi:hypothetical protein